MIDFPVHPLLLFLDPFSLRFHPLNISLESLNLFASLGLFSLTAVDPFSSQAAIPLHCHSQHNRGSVSVRGAVRLGQDHLEALEIGSLLLWCLIINSISTTQCF